MDLYPEMFVTC